MSSQHVSIDVAAPREVVYDLLADIARMPEWSPEVTGCTWLGDATHATAGTRFFFEQCEQVTMLVRAVAGALMLALPLSRG